MSSNLWKSKLGFILAASGSAIGLGNIWKFPYMTSQYGGGAFLFLYLFCVIVIGYPLLVGEVLIGRSSRKSPLHAYESKNMFWRLPGIAAFIATFIVMSYYMVIAGWSLKYLVATITGSLQFGLENNSDYSDFFTNLLGSYSSLLLYTFLFFILTMYFVIKGINSGIEKLNTYAMPLLFIILIVLAVRAVTLEGGLEAVEYLFKLDFSKINTTVIIAALGQSFFSLSIGSGAIIIYATYLNGKENILKSSTYTAGLDTLVGILAALIVIPIVFSFGHDLSQGPGLTFVTLPYMFGNMVGGFIFAILFFALLVVAALTSTVALLEVTSAICRDAVKNKLTRNQSIVVVSVSTFALSLLQMGSFNVLGGFTMFGGMTIFDVTDYLASNILLPLGGLATALYVGYIMPKHKVIQELQSEGTTNVGVKTMLYLMTTLKYFAPVVVIMVMLSITGLVKF